MFKGERHSIIKTFIQVPIVEILKKKVFIILLNF